ncbi:hypothetical protein TNCV_4203411 [Trichonephila clavipes]|uniref:Uncharacterized protein n=1 Tax=Trichonephila clavipes TaxID=2585209 RepID=A0A8X6VIB6_TRICX|nr:hypothetical protein TNCV_4203411 [Trichonephila clavipes]
MCHVGSQKPPITNAQEDRHVIKSALKDRKATSWTFIRSNTWDAQLTVPNDPRYVRLETNLMIGQAKEGQKQCRDSLVTPLPNEGEPWLVENGPCEPLHEWQRMRSQDVMDIPLGSHGATDQY